MAFQLNPQIIKDTLSKATQELPPLPNVLVKILQLTESSNSGTVGEIEQLIRSDQAISSKLLRVVNSAYFGLSGQVASVNQAVVMLGYQQVRNLVLSVTMISSFSAVGTQAKDAQMRCWEMAFATASAAQWIARKKRFDAKEVELAFVGGLLQNIGCLFMLSQLSRSYLSVLEEAENSQSRIFDVENLRLQTNHAEVGFDLMVKWKLPENLCLLVKRHEDSFEGDPIDSLYAVHVGERIAELLVHGKEASFEALELSEQVVNWLGFTEEQLQELYENAKIKVDAAMELIGSLKD